MLECNLEKSPFIDLQNLEEMGNYLCILKVFFTGTPLQMWRPLYNALQCIYIQICNSAAQYQYLIGLCSLLLSRSFHNKRINFLRFLQSHFGLAFFACASKYILVLLALCPSKYIWVTLHSHAPPNMRTSVIFVQISASSLITLKVDKWGQSNMEGDKINK